MTNDIVDWHIMIVDDESDNIGVIKLVFDFNDIDYSTALSGKECLEMIDEVTPDLMLIDIQMPEMTGFELLDRLRELPAYRETPMIAITAHAMTGDAERITAAGFNGYIAKPISVMTLLDDIKEILS